MPNAPGVAPHHPLPEGQQKIAEYRAAGVSDTEIMKWRAGKTAEWDQAGVSQVEQAKYWGENPRDSAMIREAIRTNTEANSVNNPKVATNPLEALAAGWQRSVTGLVTRNPALGGPGMPSIVMGRETSVTDTVIGSVAQFAGDLPWAIGGGIAGAGAGAAGPSEATGPAAPITELASIGAGAAFLPEASRQVLMESYRKGEIHSFGDFLRMSGEGAWATAKATATGAVSNVVGGQVGGRVLSATGNKLLGAGANTASQVVAGGAVSAGMEGRVPDAKDFTAAAVIALGIHAGGMVRGSFRPSEAGQRVTHNAQVIYEHTGIPPWELMERAQRNPALQQAILTQDVNGEPAINAAVHAAKPPPPEPYKRPAHVEVPPVEGHVSAPRLNASPALPATSGVEHFMRVMRAIEGGLNPDGSPRVSKPTRPGNHGGAIGEYQVTPGTARQYGFDPAKLYDRAYNEQVARVIAADLHRRFNGDEEAMLAAYNGGPGAGARLQRNGPGTRLESVLDKSAPNGKRYYSVKAERDESNLNPETQKYLADARRKSGGPLPGGSDAVSGVGGTGGSGNGDRPGGEGWFDPPRPRNGASGGGGGGDEPPAPGARLIEGPGGRRFSWDNVDNESLYEEMRRGIGEDGSRPKSFGDHMSNFITQMASELEPLRQIDHALLAGDELQLDRNRDMLLEDMGRQTYAANEVAGAFIRWGKVKMSIDPETGKLMRELTPDSASVMSAGETARAAGGNLLDWEGYMAARRAADLAAKGVKTPFNDDAAEVLANRPSERAKYEKATSELQQALDGGLEFAVDHGLLSNEQVLAMQRENPVYVSFRRVSGDDSLDTSTGRGRSMKVGKTFHAMGGSENGQIRSPILGVTDNLRLLVKNSMRNMVAGSIVSLAERNPQRAAAIGLKQVEWKPDTTISEAAGKAFEGYDPESIPALKQAMEPFLAERAFKSMGKNEFGFYRNGKLEKWRVEDPDLAAFLKGADTPGQANAFMQALEIAAKVKRAGVTLPLDFAFRMTGIDQWMGYILDPAHPFPFSTLIGGAKHALTMDATYKEWVVNGGAGAAIAAMDADYIARDAHAIFNETGVMDRLMNTAKHPLEFAQLISERLEAADRIGYYKQRVKKGVDPIKAATMSRKFKLDFAERGTSNVAQFMARVTPFFRAGLLGMKQTGEGIVANPGEGLLQGAMKPANVTFRALASVTLPTVALYMLNYWQDQYLPEARKYKNLPRWQRDLFFVSPEIAGVRLRLARPREIGVVFGGWVERFLDYQLQKDSKAFDSMASNFIEQFLPAYMPPGLEAPVEGATGFSFYTGRPLVPASLADASPSMQYTENTTEIAKGLSRFLANNSHGLADWSPMVVENYVKQLSGTAGMNALRLLDTPFNQNDKPWEVADVPFVQGFVIRNPGMSAKPIQEFYDELSRAKEAQADKTVAKRRRDLGEYRAAGQDPMAHVKLEAFAHVLSVKHQEIIAVNRNKEMTTDEKRQFIEAAYSRMIVVANEGVARARRAREHGVQQDLGPWGH